MTHDPRLALATGGAMVLFFAAIAIGLFAYWIISIVDVIKSDFKNDSNKILWIILLLAIAPISTILYQTIGKHQKTDAQNDRLSTRRGNDNNWQL